MQLNAAVNVKMVIHFGFLKTGICVCGKLSTIVSGTNFKKISSARLPHWALSSRLKLNFYKTLKKWRSLKVYKLKLFSFRLCCLQFIVIKNRKPSGEVKIRCKSDSPLF